MERAIHFPLSCTIYNVSCFGDRAAAPGFEGICHKNRQQNGLSPPMFRFLCTETVRMMIVGFAIGTASIALIIPAIA